METNENFPSPIPPRSPAPQSEERQWVLGIHLSALAGLFIPVGNILGPLVIWLIKKDQFPGLDPVGKAVLNFQISWAIWIVASIVVGVVGSCLFVPILLPFAAFIGWLVFTIIGAVKASNGEAYEFPLTIKML